jgi:hypothetical protein
MKAVRPSPRRSTRSLAYRCGELVPLARVLDRRAIALTQHGADVRALSGNLATTADSDFLKWMLAGGQEPNPRTGKMNCWEMALFAGYRSGYVIEKRLRSLYERAQNAMLSSGGQMEFPRELERALRTSSEQIYDPTDRNSPRPLRGDLVIFNETADHVALATGNLNGGRVEVMSLWPPPNGSTHAKITTVEALLAVMQIPTAKFWSPI